MATAKRPRNGQGNYTEHLLPTNKAEPEPDTISVSEALAEPAQSLKIQTVLWLVLVAALVALLMIFSWSGANVVNMAAVFTKHLTEERGRSVSTESLKFLRQRNEVSKLLNEAKRITGRQSCEQLILQKESGKKIGQQISLTGGWCKQASSPNSSMHMFDGKLAGKLSSFLKGKSVASFGDGPGAYKRRLDELQEVNSYTAYDGAPYCEEVTKGTVKFLDLTAPHYGLPVFDWVVSLEVGEHIPVKYEDIYLDNLVRHARTGLILSWAVPGQGGYSHVNNKPLEDVIAQLKRRGFQIDKAAGEPLREVSSFPWLKTNIQIYYRINPSSFNELDA